MQRKSRVRGPRVQIDIAALRNMPHDERLCLLTRMAVEVGGRSEAEWGDRFRKELADAQSLARAPGHVKKNDPPAE